MKIELKILEHGKNIYGCLDQQCIEPDCFNHKTGQYNNLPEYATSGSAAVDLRSVEDVTIYPGECKMIKTGIAIWIGYDYQAYPGSYGYGGSADVAGIIVPRSGLGTKGLILANTIGVIDEDYQGELLISAWNRSRLKTGRIRINKGERIAQMMFVPVIKAQWQVVDEFSNITERSDGGFGSTGVE